MLIYNNSTFHDIILDKYYKAGLERVFCVFFLFFTVSKITAQTEKAGAGKNSPAPCALTNV